MYQVSETGRSKKRSIVIALPTVVFILILMSPYLTQWGKTHHQNPDEAPTSTLDADWYNGVFNGINPQIPIEALPDHIPLTALSQFSLGLQDPQMLIFQAQYISSSFASTHGAYWRLESYDTYTGHGIEKSSTNSFNYYDGIPNSDPYSNPYDTIMTVYKNMTYSPYPEYIPAHWSYDYEERFGLLNFNESLDGWEVTVEGTEVGMQLGQTDFRTLLFSPIGTDIGAYQLQYDTPFVTDNIGDISSQSLTRDYIPQTILDSFMILPDGYPEDFNGNNLSTTIQLAADLNDNNLNVFEQALTVLGYLSTQYTYDYDMLTEGSTDTPSEDEDYVEWFLNRGSGVSIHFAMAMATLLNLENIAARAVTGFVYGDQDPGSSIRNVRALYIHSWVEVYIPTDPVTREGRWVGFDPGEHPAADLLAYPKDPNVVRSDYDIQIISTNPPSRIVTQGDPITINAEATSQTIPQQGVPITFENMNTSETIGTVTTNILGISSITYDTTGLDPGMYRIRAYFGTVEDIVDIYVTPPYTLNVWANNTVINQGEALTIYAQLNVSGGSGIGGVTIDFDDLNSAWYDSNVTDGDGRTTVIINSANTSSWSPGPHTIRAQWPDESLINVTTIGVIGQPDPMSIGENPVKPLKTSTETSLSLTSKFYGIMVSYGLYVFVLLLHSIVLKSLILPFFENRKILCLKPMMFYT